MIFKMMLLTFANLSVPISKTGSKVFNLRISGCRRLIGTPLTLINPAPFFTKATAVAVFYQIRNILDYCHEDKESL
jgi:hypothetical protein